MGEAKLAFLGAHSKIYHVDVIGSLPYELDGNTPGGDYQTSTWQRRKKPSPGRGD